jgi:RNA recognition motif-containing protein
LAIFGGFNRCFSSSPTLRLISESSQIRQGIANNTKGTAFVVYEDVMDSKAACDKLNGFNFQNRYLVVLYHQVLSFLASHLSSIAKY